MTTEFRDRLIVKCLKIYEREKCLKPVDRFLKRLDLELSLQFDLWDNCIIPEIRKRHFPAMTLDSLLHEMLAFYRSSTSPAVALTDIWEMLDWKIPFINNEYEDFLERFEALLENEPNPPSRADWDYLDECLRM